MHTVVEWPCTTCCYVIVLILVVWVLYNAIVLILVVWVLLWLFLYWLCEYCIIKFSWCCQWVPIGCTTWLHHTHMYHRLRDTVCFTIKRFGSAPGWTYWPAVDGHHFHPLHGATGACLPQSLQRVSIVLIIWQLGISAESECSEESRFLFFKIHLIWLILQDTSLHCHYLIYPQLDTSIYKTLA